MEQFEFKVDTSTPWMKALNALGFILLGFTASFVLFSYKFREPIDWMHTFTSTILSLGLGFFPGRAKLSIYTKEQIKDLKSYLQEIASQKEVEYLG